MVWTECGCQKQNATQLNHTFLISQGQSQRRKLLAKVKGRTRQQIMSFPTHINTDRLACRDDELHCVGYWLYCVNHRAQQVQDSCTEPAA